MTAAEREGLGEGLPSWTTDTVWHPSHHKLQMLLSQSNIFDCETPSYSSLQNYSCSVDRAAALVHSTGHLRKCFDIELED